MGYNPAIFGYALSKLALLEILLNMYFDILNLIPQYIKCNTPLSKTESIKFSLIESVICLFTDSSVNKYFLLLNQLIFTDSSVKKIFITVKSVNFH